MASGLPYFQWYPADAEADESYRCMTFEELGLFHRALNSAWVNDGLPSSCERIALALHASKDVFDRSWPVVSECFFLADDGRLRNRRQEEQREKAQSKSQKAKHSAQERWSMRSHSERNAKAMPRAYDSDSDSDSDSSVVTKISKTQHSSSNADAGILSDIAKTLHQYVKHFGMPWPQPDAEICRKVYAALGTNGDWSEKLVAVLVDLEAKKQKPGKSYAWFLATIKARSEDSHA